ncbi:MAG: hypothetical protein V1777_03870 [Candidatus Micrarchaeota archaeon]
MAKADLKKKTKGAFALDFGGIKKLGFGKIKNRYFGEIKKIEFDGIRKINFGEIKKFGFSGIKNFDFEGVKNTGFNGIKKFDFGGIKLSGFGEIKKIDFSRITNFDLKIKYGQYRLFFLKFLEEKIRSEQEPEIFAKRILKKSAVFWAIAWFLGALFYQQLALSFAIGALAGVFCFVFLLFEPVRKRKQESLEIEADLPFVLMAISVELALNWPFEKILLHAGQSGFGKASRLFLDCHREIHEKGAGVHEALAKAAGRLDSKDAKRAMVQVMLAYEEGPGGPHKGENVRRLAKELLAKQRIASKAFSGKIALFSLVFIAVSAVVPAIFQAIVIVGSSFLDFQIGPWQVLAIIAVGFPALDLAVLVLLQNKTPVFLKQRQA